MVHFSTLLFAFSVAGSVTAAPTQLDKRIAQDINTSTKKWEAACDAANGGAKCNEIAVKAFGTLLAGAGACDQQDNADIMMDLSRQLKSDQMISLAQIFCQQPRNSPNSLTVPYCQQKPRNAELDGLFQCQFQGVDPQKFADGSALGAPGTTPLGQNGPLNPPGSCPANPSGPIPAGQQLADIVQSPGVPGGSGAAGNDTTRNSSPAPSSAPDSATQAITSSAASAANTSPASAATQAIPSSAASAANTSPASAATQAIPSSAASTANTPITPRAAANSSASGSGFKAQNGKDAQALNQKFQSLTADSPCTDGEQACVTGQFAQCTGGKFALTPCTNGLACTALPLVNKPGTSVTCDTQADSAARVSQALGSRDDTTDILVQNAKDAQALNQMFPSLTADSPCTKGDSACITGQFAQCVDGKFSLTPCTDGSICIATPIESSNGTLVSCDTQDNADQRISQALNGHTFNGP